MTFDAALEGDMFHEIAHGLGIKRTIDGTATVRDALQGWANPIEEQKANVLGQFMLDRLDHSKEVDTQPRMDRYVTHIAILFRFARLDATNPYAIVAAAELAFYAQHGALVRLSDTGRYRIDPDRMPGALEDLAGRLLVIQGDGDVNAARSWCATAVLTPELHADLDRVGRARIPVDVFFENPPAIG